MGSTEEEPSGAERMQRLDDTMEKMKQEARAKLGIEEPPGAKPAEAPPAARPEPDVEAEIDEQMRKQKDEDMEGHIIGEMPVDFVCGCGCYGGRGWLYVPGQCDSCYQQWGPDGRDEPGPEPEDAETAYAGYQGGSALPRRCLSRSRSRSGATLSRCPRTSADATTTTSRPRRSPSPSSPSPSSPRSRAAPRRLRACTPAGAGTPR